jgi:acetyl-CoA C-acetyltransferase
MGLALASKVGIVVLAGARTPIGSFGGMLKDVPGYELGAVAAREALSRAGVAAEDLDEVVMGCIGQVGPDAYNARW